MNHEASDSPTQKTLFATEYSRHVTPPPAPPANSTATSQAAASSVERYTPTQRDRVLAAIIAAGGRGATNEELAIALNMRTQSVTARRNELVKLGLIEVRGKRPASSGCNQEIVFATQKGKEHGC